MYLWCLKLCIALERESRDVMSLKLNMSKAYDGVEWAGFLEIIMLRLGFDHRWVTLVLSCINFISYKVLINGVPAFSFEV